MNINDYEILDSTGFRWTDTGLTAARLRADFGDGYEAGARIAGVKGLRSWSLTVDVLPNIEDYIIITDAKWHTRAAYLYDFWRRHKLEKDSELFVMRDVLFGTKHLARFAEDNLSFGVLTEMLFSTGLEIIEQRVKGVTFASSVSTTL